MRLVLLRHGRTVANDRWLYCGSTDLSLSANGLAELNALRDAGGYPDKSGYAVFTSGMRRTEETLEILYGPAAHTVLPGLREMDFGQFEMHSYEQLKDDPCYRAWCDGDNEGNVAPGGESGRIMQRRVLDTINALLSKGEDALIVTHGGPIAAIMAFLFPTSGKNRFEWQPKNGCGYLITADGDNRTWQSIPTGGDINGG